MRKLFNFYYITDNRFKRGWWILFHKLNVEERFILSVYYTDFVNKNNNKRGMVGWKDLIPSEFRNTFIKKLRKLHRENPKFFEYAKESKRSYEKMFTWNLSHFYEDDYKQIIDSASCFHDLCLRMCMFIAEKIKNDAALSYWLSNDANLSNLDKTLMQ